MSRVRNRDTSLERRVRSELHGRGFRFRKHSTGVSGKPDVVFPRERVAVFIDGDFWHGWRFPRWKAKLSDFWKRKIETNRRRDRRTFNRLRCNGWKVVRLWQHQIERDFEGSIRRIEAALASRRC